MNNPLRVGCIEAIGDLDRRVEDLVRAKWLPLNTVLERLAFQELHRDDVPAFMLIDIADGADIGVIESGGCAEPSSYKGKLGTVTFFRPSTSPEFVLRIPEKGDCPQFCGQSAREFLM